LEKDDIKAAAEALIAAAGELEEGDL